MASGVLVAALALLTSCAGPLRLRVEGNVEDDLNLVYLIVAGENPLGDPGARKPLQSLIESDKQVENYLFYAHIERDTESRGRFRWKQVQSDKRATEIESFELVDGESVAELSFLQELFEADDDAYVIALGYSDAGQWFTWEGDKARFSGVGGYVVRFEQTEFSARALPEESFLGL